MDEAWMIYLEELRDRAEDLVHPDTPPDEALEEALQEAFEATADRLHVQEDWKQSRAHRISKGFLRVTEVWLRDPPEEGGMEWDDLEERLELFQKDWDSEPGPTYA